MKKQAVIALLCAGLSVVPAGCAIRAHVSDALYNRADSEALYALQDWRFMGRLAVYSAEDSWSANIRWRHQPGNDRLVLSAPLGQGAVSIILNGGCVSISQGKGDADFSCEPNRLISDRLGVFVPIDNLSFWVLGLPGQDADFQDVRDGFMQSGWQVQVDQLMSVDDQLMPHRIEMSNDKKKLKLIIDQWELNDGFNR